MLCGTKFFGAAKNTVGIGVNPTCPSHLDIGPRFGVRGRPRWNQGSWLRRGLYLAPVRGERLLQNESEDREGDDYACCEDGHFADFAGEGSGVDLGAST